MPPIKSVNSSTSSSGSVEDECAVKLQSVFRGRTVRKRRASTLAMPGPTQQGSGADEGSIDFQVEGLVLSLWRQRRESGHIAKVAEQLIALAAAPGALDVYEFYLPQFVHMIVQLSSELPELAAVEKFVLTLCQMSIPLALQCFWMVYAVLQESRPKVGGDVVVYRRCCALLLRLEQCVVYGSGGTDGGAARDILAECVKVAVSAQQCPSSASDRDAVHSGWLLKKGGGTSKWGRRNWSRRYLAIRQRVLYYYDSDAPGAVPKGSIALSSAEARLAATPHKHAHYFEVACSQSGLVLKLRASSEDERVAWMQALNASAALPSPPGVSAQEIGSFMETLKEESATLDAVAPLAADEYRKRSITLSQGGAAGLAAGADGTAPRVYSYFNSQRNFVRALTNVAEELRFLQPGEGAGERQAVLEEYLNGVPLPPMTFYPLQHSSERMAQILRFAPGEGVVFNTKARCPLMLFLEVKELKQSVAEALKTNALPEPDAVSTPANGAANGGGSGSGSGLSVGDRKREEWRAKVERVGAKSELRSTEGWALKSFIVKSNDDLRQEVFVMQMITYFRSIFPTESCWLNTYHIQATGPDTGLLETITSSQDIDGLKKHQPGLSLIQMFEGRYGARDGAKFKEARDNFAKSLGAYSIVMWLLLLRDRHNGNLMLTQAGHYFHIDFGFILGHSTGGGIGGMVESSPWKLTAEYVEVLGGVGSPGWELYCTSCVKAMQAAHEHGEAICTLVEITGARSHFPCFEHMPVERIIPKLRERLFLHRKADQVEAETRRVIEVAREHKGTRYYDYFQNKQQGYAI